MTGTHPRLEFFVEPFVEGQPGRHVEAAIAEDSLSAVFPDALIRSEIHEVTP